MKYQGLRFNCVLEENGEGRATKTAVKAGLSFSLKAEDIVLHFLPFHFVVNKYPACLQQTSFKTFFQEVQIPPSYTALKCTKAQPSAAPEVLFCDLAGDSQPSSWPWHSLGFATGIPP